MKKNLRMASSGVRLGVGLALGYVWRAKAAVVFTDGNEYVGADGSDVNVLTILLALIAVVLLMGCLLALGYWLLRRYFFPKCSVCDEIQEDVKDSDRTSDDTDSSCLKSPEAQGYQPALRWPLPINTITRPSPNRPIVAGSGTGTNVSE